MTPDIISFTEYVMYIEEEYVSECCDAPPAMEMDMSTVPYGGPSGFCGRCYDNCIFIKLNCNDWIDSLGANGVYGRD